MSIVHFYLSLLFIILFLHQTTTHRPLSRHPLGCLSSCSYIKPQQIVYGLINNHGCLSSCSYIKPQLKNGYKELFQVVYHLVPTSNHNWRDHLRIAFRLFIILFLHQTTTSAFMHSHKIRCLSSCSYIKPQLILWEIKNPVVVYHLVPTSNHNLVIFGNFNKMCCLSSCSYIKPQPPYR